MTVFDLLIRGGTVLDGRGSHSVVADVAIVDGLIAEIGPNLGAAQQTIDAAGCMVTPGFIDGHTHLDAQIFWDPYAGSLASHGVTSAVMGNCGFSLAPGTEADADLVLRSIERAEDMSREAIQRGVPWSWRSFPEYLDAVEALPKGLNIGAQLGHSALRAAVMGERAFTGDATEDDLEAMQAAVRMAMECGAVGFSTSRSHAHVTKAGAPVASRMARWDEVARLVMAMSQVGRGMFQLAPERPSDPADIAAYQSRLQALAVASGRPLSFMVGGQKEQLDAVDGVRNSGGVAFGQVHVRGFENIFGFKTALPFDRLPLWSSIRSVSRSEQRRALADPNLRARLVAEAESGDYGQAIGAEIRAPQFDQIMVIDDADVTERSVAEIARPSGASPVDVMIDLALHTDFDQLFRQPIGQVSKDLVLDGLRHPNTVIAASDSGAHISQILDSNIPTYFLSHWVRSLQAFEWPEAIRMLTGRPAEIWGLERRGALAPEFSADIVVFDPATIACEQPKVVNDLPDGGPRLAQASRGIRATIVNGDAVMVDGEATGATPGRLLRGGRAA